MRLSHLPLFAVLVLAWDFSFAQEKRSLVIEEVVVTARKQEESSQDVPIAITALTSELKNSSIRDLKDVTGYSPNVTITEDGSRGGGGAVINIRGLSPTRSDDNSFDAPIAVVIVALLGWYWWRSLTRPMEATPKEPVLEDGWK